MREREQHEKLILGKWVWIPVCGRRGKLDFSKEFVSCIRAVCEMSIPYSRPAKLCEITEPSDCSKILKKKKNQAGEVRGFHLLSLLFIC